MRSRVCPIPWTSWTSWPAPAVPDPARDAAQPLRAARHGDRQRSARPQPGDDAAHVRLRHHALRRDPSRPRRDLPGLRPGAAGVARRRPRRALRAERHRRRRPAARAGRADRRELDAPGRARDRAVPRGHDRAAGAAAGRLRRRGRGDPEITDGDRAGCSTPGAAYRVDDDIYFDVDASGRLRLRVAATTATTMLRAVRRARRRPGPRRQARPARLAAVAGHRAASRSGTPRSARDGRAGTSSAR